MDSVVTIDVLLSRPNEEFAGGKFQTLEVGGEMAEHAFHQGDAVAFLSHKFHCVGQVETGIRRVLVMELWRGPARSCPHRCEFLGKSCPMEPGYTAQPSAEPLLPFRLGGVEGLRDCGELLWQTNETEKPPAPKAIEVDEEDEEWDLFGD